MTDIHKALELWSKKNNDREYIYDDKEGLIILDGKENPDLNVICQNYELYKKENAYLDKRKSEYPSIPDQLDMIYNDMVNNTSSWKDMITSIKKKYPKEI